jgi:transcriptional regulator with XRE-family HTH domain
MSNDSARAALAANLRRLRVAARTSLSELARATGVGKATLSAIENGRGNPTVETLAALAAALGVPVVDLLAVPEPAPVTVVRAGRGERVGASAAAARSDGQPSRRVRWWRRRRSRRARGCT